LVELDRGEAIYYFGGLDPQFLSFMPNQPYPPGMPAVRAIAFHFMGAPDDTTLHVQYWFYAAGFVAAVAGLLAPRVRATILVPSFFLIFLAPSFITWSTRTYVDFPLGYLLATAALLTFYWVEERQPWQLVTVTLLLSAAMLTKREGILLAACVVLAGLAASARDWRTSWPRLAAAGVIALILELPWRIWFTLHGIASDAPSGGVVGELADTGRGWATVKLVASTLVAPDVWRLAPLVGAAAIVLALLARAWLPAIYVCTFVASAAVMAVWIIWSEVALPITMRDSNNPIVRMTGTSILVLVAFTPLLLERVWAAARGPTLLPPCSAQSFSYGSHLPPGDRRRGRPRLSRFDAHEHLRPDASRRDAALSSNSDCMPAPTPRRAMRVVVGYADSIRRPTGFARERRQAAWTGCESPRTAAVGSASS
jgi:4-amino-4-deoxy-L-arabinose transferase-like glycosyltransferase